MSAWEETQKRKVELKAPLGLSSLVDQRVSKTNKKGYLLNLMLVGEAGLGKSSFINTLFDSNLVKLVGRSFEERKDMKFTVDTFVLEENGVTLTLRVFESIAFGVHVKKEDGIHSVFNFLKEQLIEYHREKESEERNPSFVDPRIHACLYFLRPSGHLLSELDMKTIPLLQKYVNLIPLISRADSFTHPESRLFKELIMNLAKENSFEFYPFRFYPNFDRTGYPYSLINSEGRFEVDGKEVRGRKFRWGVVQVDNPDHCEFTQLKKLLLDEGYLKLLQCTNEIFEEFRKEFMKEQGITESLLQCDPGWEQHSQDFAKQKEDWIRSSSKREEALQEQFKRLQHEKEVEISKREDLLVEKRAKFQQEIADDKKKIEALKAQLQELTAQTEEEEEDGKGEKKKKRVSLSGVSKSLRKK